MRAMDYTGAAAVVQLIEDGLALGDIVDRYGRAVHPQAKRFMSYHRTAKRFLIRKCKNNSQLCAWLKAKDPLPRRAK